ncbi:hypothetical protein BDQ17DRAFT_1351189 [Cyathus striatus]|nr:hypothetical protein BDQ17DRAFT_1351189 [Cyathus striatus]
MKSIVVASLFFPLAFGAEYLVGVGKDETTGKKGMGFDPSSIHPAAGDVIAFEFRSGSHSVVQSSYEKPCTALENGFYSGVVTVADNLEVDVPDLPQVRLTINDTNPLWLFDQAGGLCQKGAVLSINPTLDQSAGGFKENAAKDAGVSLTTSSTPTSGATSSSTVTSSSVAGSATSSNVAFRDHVPHWTALAGALASIWNML